MFDVTDMNITVDGIMRRASPGSGTHSEYMNLRNWSFAQYVAIY